MFIIYRATNLVNGKVYIGQSSRTLSVRMSEHERSARFAHRHKRKTEHFHYALVKYHFSFMWEIIDAYHDITQEKLDELESFYINHHKELLGEHNIYNKTNGGATNFGMSVHTRKKMSESHLGVQLSENHRTAISEGQKKSQKGSGNNFFGKKHSEETLAYLKKKQNERYTFTFRHISGIIETAGSIRNFAAEKGTTRWKIMNGTSEWKLIEKVHHG